MTSYVVAASKEWFKKHPKGKEYDSLQIHEVCSKEDLNLNKLSKINPRYIFFPHWSWKVDAEIHQRFDCVVFHTAPLPYGRGGSPIQNLILNGFRSSPVCALKMTEQLDGGPIYMSSEISLEGKLSDIFTRLASSIEMLIVDICNNNPIPIDQVGEVYDFRRLTQSDNEIPSNSSLNEIYDRIRMLDSEDYPSAYISFGSHVLELSNAQFSENSIIAKIKILPNKKKNVFALSKDVSNGVKKINNHSC